MNKHLIRLTAVDGLGSVVQEKSSLKEKGYHGNSSGYVQRLQGREKAYRRTMVDKELKRKIQTKLRKTLKLIINNNKWLEVAVVWNLKVPKPTC